MMTLFSNCSPRYIGVCCGLICFLWAHHAHSAFFIPTSVSGSISYGYGYTKSGGGGETESQSISLNLNGSGFIWQPWFIHGAAGLTVGYNRSDASTASSSSTSRAIGGGLDINVFPYSRFPFSLSISHNNTRLDSSESFGGVAAYETTSTRILARQSYFPRSGYDTNASWSHSRVETFSSSSTSDVVNADTRKYYEKSSWVTAASYSTVDDSSSNRKPENYSLLFNHSYTPGNQASISSLVSTSQNKVKGDGLQSEGKNVQASSIFSWRPEYRPYNFSGGARISAIETQQGVADGSDLKSNSNAASLSLGLNYRLNRKMTLMMTGAGSGSSEETDNSQSTQTTAGVGASTSYNSDVHSFSGFQYGWNAGGGANANYVNTKTTNNIGTETDYSDSISTLGVNLGHRISRGWSVGRSTGMSFSASQSVGVSGSDNGATGAGTGIGANLSGSNHGIKGSSYAGVSVSESYSVSKSEEDDKSELESQFVTADISRNQMISRLSALTANANVQWRRQISSTQPSTTTRNVNANLSYRQQRFLGIYAMNFDSTAAYNLIFNPDEKQTAYMYWRNAWRYTVGLLDLSLFIDFAREGDSPTRGSLRFRATRSF